MVFTPFQTMTDPGDHFQVTAWVMWQFQTISTIAGSKIVPCDNFTNRRLLKAWRMYLVIQHSHLHTFNFTQASNAVLKIWNGVQESHESGSRCESTHLFLKQNNTESTILLSSIHSQRTLWMRERDLRDSTIQCSIRDFSSWGSYSLSLSLSLDC